MALEKLSYSYTDLPALAQRDPIRFELGRASESDSLASAVNLPNDANSIVALTTNLAARFDVRLRASSTYNLLQPIHTWQVRN